ncbi:MAG: hypothetical protein LIP77_09180 [Planctomycetes bacterium]|nr:hypothetical protein [Planctomycetota bacterium]
MDNHYFDASGVYLGSAAANPGSLPPANATRTPPPERAGFWPVRRPDGDGWELREDNRGRRGWTGSGPVVVRDLGPLPPDWMDEPPEAAPTEDYRARRAEAFRLESDGYRDRWLNHYAEAEAWRAAGNGKREAAARARAREARRQVLAAKEAGRGRVPAAAGEEEEEGEEGEATVTAAYYLTGTGVYHRAECSYRGASGEWLEETALAARLPDARPCQRCGPPDLA